MNDQNWKAEYINWKSDLKPYQIKLLEEGPNSNSQTLLLNDMWLEWKHLAAKRKIAEISGKSLIEDPWNEELLPCKIKKSEIDESYLKFVEVRK